MCVRQADLSANYRERYWLFSYCWPAAVKGLPPKNEELKQYLFGIADILFF